MTMTTSERAVILEKAIVDYLDGNYPHPRQYRPGKCPHGIFYWDDCGACIDKHFQRALDRANAGEQEGKP